MTAVSSEVQEVYENRVLNEFYTNLGALCDCDKAFHDSVLYARGVHDGGALVGYRYDFDKAVKKLCTVYEYRKLVGGGDTK